MHARLNYPTVLRRDGMVWHGTYIHLFPFLAFLSLARSPLARMQRPYMVVGGRHTTQRGGTAEG